MLGQTGPYLAVTVSGLQCQAIKVGKSDSWQHNISALLDKYCTGASDSSYDS